MSRIFFGRHGLRRHDHDTVTEKNRFFEIVRYEKDRDAILVEDFEQRFVHD